MVIAKSQNRVRIHIMVMTAGKNATERTFPHPRNSALQGVLQAADMSQRDVWGLWEPGSSLEASSLPHSDPDGSQGTSWRPKALCPGCRGITDFAKIPFKVPFAALPVAPSIILEQAGFQLLAQNEKACPVSMSH